MGTSTWCWRGYDKARNGCVVSRGYPFVSGLKRIWKENRHFAGSPKKHTQMCSLFDHSADWHGGPQYRLVWEELPSATPLQINMMHSPNGMFFEGHSFWGTPPLGPC